MPSKERITYLFQRFFDKNGTEEEKKALMTYINSADQDEYLKSLIDQTWENELPEYHQPDERAQEIFWEIMHHQSVNETPALSVTLQQPKQLRRWWRYAAAVLILVAATYWFSTRHTGNTLAQNKTDQYSADTGELKTVQLPDGTVVTMNANSTIRLATGFNHSNRQLELTGEAFFKVVPNASKPFIIHTSQMDIRVLGTSFNVKAYPDDQNFETSLIQGSVEISMNDEEKNNVILKPNEKIIVKNRKPAATNRRQISHIVAPVTISSDSSIQEINWTKNILDFNDESFEEIAKKIERWYGVKMSFENSKVRQLRFTIPIEKESLDLAMKALQLASEESFNYEYNQHNKTILVR